MIKEVVDIRQKSSEPTTLPHTTCQFSRWNCYITQSRMSGTTTWPPWRFISQTPATRGRSSPRSPAGPIEPPAERTRPPSDKGRYSPSGSGRIRSGKGWMEEKEEEEEEEGEVREGLHSGWAACGVEDTICSIAVKPGGWGGSTRRPRPHDRKPPSSGGTRYLQQIANSRSYIFLCRRREKKTKQKPAVVCLKLVKLLTSGLGWLA